MSSPRRDDGEDRVDPLVRAYLDAQAAGIDGAAGAARVRAALRRPQTPAAPWRPRLVALAAGLAAAVVLAVLGQFSATPAQASSRELVEQTQAAHREPAERLYDVEVRRAAKHQDAFPPVPRTLRRVTVHTRGDRFWVEARHAEGIEPFVWGRDGDGALWAVLAADRGVRAPAEQAPPALKLLADVYSLDVDRLLDHVLRDCELSEEQWSAGGVRVIRAEPRSPQTKRWLGQATLEIDARQKTLRRLTITRNRGGEPFAEAVFRLTQTRPADEGKYRLEGHLARPHRVHKGNEQLVRRDLLARWMGQKKEKAEPPPPPVVEMMDVEGRAQTPLSQPDRKATVLFFLMADCPISNAYAPEIRRICQAYAAKQVSAFVVHSDPDTDVERARKHAKDYDLPCPVLLDPTHRLVRRTGVTKAPEVAVIAEGKVVYRGRIDDWYVDYGKRRAEPTVRDLRDALDAVLGGKPVARATVPALGRDLPEPRKFEIPSDQ